MQLADDRAVEKQRHCLRCNKEFLSTGAGNRICSKCTSNAPSVSGLRCITFDHESERNTDAST